MAQLHYEVNYTLKTSESNYSATLCNLLLYGSYNLTLVQNRMIIAAKIDDIQKTNRLT